MLAEAAGGSLPLDAAENESGNTATHIAAFGGCIELAQQLVCLGASVGLPNRDGFTPLDSMQASLPALGLSPRPSSPSSAILSLSLSLSLPLLPLPPHPRPHSSAVRLSGERRPVAVASAATPLEDREASGVDARPDGVGLPAVQATVQPRRPEHGSQAPLPPLRTLRVLAVLAAPRRDPEVRLDTRGTLVRPLRARRFRKLKPKHLSAGLLKFSIILSGLHAAAKSTPSHSKLQGGAPTVARSSFRLPTRIEEFKIEGD